MSDFYIGIDCGSTFCKGALYGHGQIHALAVRPSGWDLAEAARRVTEALVAGQPIEAHSAKILATGYGREKVAAHSARTEITCHARGAEYLSPGVRTVIDIGGQDYKIIKTREGKALSFQMNDKCAAGSGRFLEMVLQRLAVGLEELDSFLAAEKSVPLNSTCAVFAESEIIGLLAEGRTREEILGGVAHSMSAKIAAQAARINVDGPVTLTGGLAASAGLSRALSRALNIEVAHLANGPYAGAIGAALCLADAELIGG